jgi:hypothetical protein
MAEGKMYYPQAEIVMFEKSGHNRKWKNLQNFLL